MADRVQESSKYEEEHKQEQVIQVRRKIVDVGDNVSVTSSHSSSISSLPSKVSDSTVINFLKAFSFGKKFKKADDRMESSENETSEAILFDDTTLTTEGSYTSPTSGKIYEVFNNVGGFNDSTVASNQYDNVNLTNVNNSQIRTVSDLTSPKQEPSKKVVHSSVTETEEVTEKVFRSIIDLNASKQSSNLTEYSESSSMKTTQPKILRPVYSVHRMGNTSAPVESVDSTTNQKIFFDSSSRVNEINDQLHRQPDSGSPHRHVFHEIQITRTQEINNAMKLEEFRRNVERSNKEWRNTTMPPLSGTTKSENNQLTEDSLFKRISELEMFLKSANNLLDVFLEDIKHSRSNNEYLYSKLNELEKSNESLRNSLNIYRTSEKRARKESLRTLQKLQDAELREQDIILRLQKVEDEYDTLARDLHITERIANKRTRELQTLLHDKNKLEKDVINLKSTLHKLKSQSHYSSKKIPLSPYEELYPQYSTLPRDTKRHWHDYGILTRSPRLDPQFGRAYSVTADLNYADPDYGWRPEVTEHQENDHEESTATINGRINSKSGEQKAQEPIPITVYTTGFHNSPTREVISTEDQGNKTTYNKQIEEKVEGRIFSPKQSSRRDNKTTYTEPLDDGQLSSDQGKLPRETYTTDEDVGRYRSQVLVKVGSLDKPDIKRKVAHRTYNSKKRHTYKTRESLTRSDIFNMSPTRTHRIRPASAAGESHKIRRYDVISTPTTVRPSTSIGNLPSPDKAYSVDYYNIRPGYSSAIGTPTLRPYNRSAYFSMPYPNSRIKDLEQYLGALREEQNRIEAGISRIQAMNFPYPTTLKYTGKKRLDENLNQINIAVERIRDMSTF